MSHPQMTAYLARARWFAGKGRGHEVTDVDRVASVHLGETLFTLDVLTVTYQGTDATRDTERYQMPLVHLEQERADLAHALLGRQEGRWTYDAVHDPESMARYLGVFARTAPGEVTQVGGAAFHRVVADDLDWGAPARVLTGEQSNTTVVYGGTGPGQVLLKLFRRLTPGRNPDIEVHEALTRAGSSAVGALHGWVQAGEGEHATDLAMLQEFLADAADGWALTLRAAGEDADVTDGARTLGAAVARVHESLAAEFGVEELDGPEVSRRMRVRLESALVGLPELAPYADGLRAAFDGLEDLPAQQVHRVHGDLHLGQTLLTPQGWRLVDFEGEPATSLAERVLPDSPWRDVAGMLRSYDYAARTADATQAWLSRHRAAFLEGYATRPLSPVEVALLDAYEADKAVYEVGYEARNRPDWVDIPLAAIRRIATPTNLTGGRP